MTLEPQGREEKVVGHDLGVRTYTYTYNRIPLQLVLCLGFFFLLLDVLICSLISLERTYLSPFLLFMGLFI